MIANLVRTMPLKAILQRFPGVWLLGVVWLTFCGPFYAPVLFMGYFLLLHINFFANNVRVAYGQYELYKHAKECSYTDWFRKYCEQTGTKDGSDSSHDMPFDSIVHVIILPNYKEDMDTLCETLDVLASHRRAATQYRVVLAMEESEKGSKDKAEKIQRMYSRSFLDITYAIHPVNLPGEIRGKSSNVNWAASEMARRHAGPGRSHSNQILTVMDADTCFAEDYFNCVTYHYCVASPEQRKIMMFSPPIVFDRNANDVPFTIRVTDMFWSIGHASNLYDSCPSKIPCSSYSVSMDLANAVNFWDCGPEAMGEDMHMYLKCYFATDGHLNIHTVFSPASQCNVEGEGTGIQALITGTKARFYQALRHLWGSLDTGYTVRRTVTRIFAPELEPSIELKNARVDKIGKSSGSGFPFPVMSLLTLLHRIAEAHTVTGHYVFMMFFCNFLISDHAGANPAYAWWLTSFFGAGEIDPWVSFALYVGFWIRFWCLPFNLVMIWYHEKYHYWVAVERWTQSERNFPQATPRSPNEEFTSIGGMKPVRMVQHLGRRSQLLSIRKWPLCLIDWIGIVFCGFFFYVIPQFRAQLTHLFTDRLEYKVASKPQLSKPPTPTDTPMDRTEKFFRPSPTTNAQLLTPQVLSSVIAKAAAEKEKNMIPGNKSLDDADADSVLSSASSNADERYFEEDGMSA